MGRREGSWHQGVVVLTPSAHPLCCCLKPVALLLCSDCHTFGEEQIRWQKASKDLCFAARLPKLPRGFGALHQLCCLSPGGSRWRCRPHGAAPPAPSLADLDLAWGSFHAGHVLNAFRHPLCCHGVEFES